MDAAAEKTRKYYDEVGWQVDGGKTTDRRLWVDDRLCATDYEGRYYARIREAVPAGGERILDVGCGPLEDLRYAGLSSGFRERHFVDLSHVALEAARSRVGEGGVFHCGDFLDLDFGEDAFDCVLSSHSLYHVHRDFQSLVVRKMLRVARPGAPVVVAYKHGDSLLDSWGMFKDFLAAFGAGWGDRRPDREPYAYTHGRSWWCQFSDVAEVDVRPLHTFDVGEQRALFPDDARGRAGLTLLGRLEDWRPDFFIYFGKYCLVTLRKRPALSS